MDAPAYPDPMPATPELLAAIGEAIGLQAPYTERPMPRTWIDWLDRTHEGPPPNDDTALKVLGGAVSKNGQRIAWVEEHTHSPALAVDGDLWITMLLHVCDPDLEHREPEWIYAHENMPDPPQVSAHLLGGADDRDDRPDRVTGVEAVELKPDGVHVHYRWCGSEPRSVRFTFAPPPSKKIRRKHTKPTH